MGSNRAGYRLALILLLSILGSCNTWEREEIARYTSPDSAVDAVLVGGSAGATTSYVYELYLVPLGSEIPDDPESSVFAADHVDSLQIRWRRPKLLEIEYEQARIHRFKNHDLLLGIPGPRRVVELRLVPLTDSTSLSAQDL